MKLIPVRVENSTGSTEIDVKRFYVPATILWTCPKCGGENAEDLESQYLSYPSAGAPFRHTLYCGKQIGDTDCDSEHETELLLELKLSPSARCAGDRGNKT